MGLVGRNELGEFRQLMNPRRKVPELRRYGSLLPAYDYFNRLLNILWRRSTISATPLGPKRRSFTRTANRRPRSTVVQTWSVSSPAFPWSRMTLPTGRAVIAIMRPLPILPRNATSNPSLKLLLHLFARQRQQTLDCCSIQLFAKIFF